MAPVEGVLGTDIKIFFLKIDVEGFELNVMKTAANLLRNVRGGILLTLSATWLYIAVDLYAAPWCSLEILRNWQSVLALHASARCTEC